MEWVSDCLELHARERVHVYLAHAQRRKRHGWSTSRKGTAGSLRTKANSWTIGANIPGKARVVLVASPDSPPVFRDKHKEIAAKGYEGFLLQ